MARGADDFVYRPVVAVGEKRGAGVGLERLDVAGPVVFLVPAGLLVLLEHSVEIVLRVERRDDAGLRMGAHRLAVGVEAGLFVADERTVRHQPGKGLRGLRIRLGRRAVHSVGKVDLGTRYMQKTAGVARRKGARLRSIYNVIGNCRDKRGVPLVRPDGRKGTYMHQKPMFTSGQN